MTLAPRTRRRLPWLLAGGACLLIVAVLAIFCLTPPPRSANPKRVPPTSVVQRQDLVEQTRVSGTLGYGAAASVGTALAGTLTQLAPVGSIVGRGRQLLRVDDTPVILFIGPLPAWRPFGSGMPDGNDVLELEQNLAALGFFPPAPDRHFDATTGRSIRTWQRSVGLSPTGTIEFGRIVFQAGERRVAAQLAHLGDQVGAGVLSLTGTDRLVSAELLPDQGATIGPETAVNVTLPDGSLVPAKVSSVGAVSDHDDGKGGSTARMPLTIALDDHAAAPGLDGVTVGIGFRTVLATNALVVPVLALLAQTDSTFAVQVRTGRKTRLVPVTLGAFAGSSVEVTGGALSAGDRVVVGL
jgi:multidrug efflux pump subunit AcrA (membrane-fusion protein)